jgi:hypothetical protein
MEQDNKEYTFKAKRRDIIAVVSGVFALVAGWLWKDHLPVATFFFGLALGTTIGTFFFSRDKS